MRIIGGKFKSRRFYPPADNWPTRPTTDYAKEGLFNILNNHFDFEETKVPVAQTPILAPDTQKVEVKITNDTRRIGDK